MTQSKNTDTWFLHLGYSKREGVRLWDTYKSHEKGEGGKGIGRLTMAFIFLQSSTNLPENLHTPSSNVYPKFQSSRTSIGLSVRVYDQGEEENDSPYIL
jgi:hypothetical protein